ncbi:hypothetical protein BLNAU_1787 [Blattamonas nauphoetae]|nr:hypothetical protein BLNAU_1787 [Blattamonas nauphoetae]
MNQTTVLLLRVLEAQHQNLVQWRDFFSCVVELGNGFSAAVAKGQIVSQCEEAIDGIDEIITSLLSHPSTSVSPQHLPMLTSTQLHELAQVVNSTNTFLHETQRFVYANWETTDPTLMLEGLGLIISATLSILVILISFCSSQTDRPVSRRVKSTIGLVLCALTLSFIVFGLETLFHSQMRDVIPANSVIQTVYHHLGESHTVFGLTLLLLCLSSLLINKPFDNFISKAADFLRGSMTKINCTSIILFLVSLFFVISLLTSSFIICEQYMHFFFSIVLTVLVLVTSVFIFYTSRMKSRQEEVPITVSLRSLLRMTSKQKEATTTVPLSNAVLIFSLIPSVLTLVFISLQLHLTGFHPHNPPVVYPFSVLISSTIPRSLIWRLIFVVLNLATVTIAVGFVTFLFNSSFSITNSTETESSVLTITTKQRNRVDTLLHRLFIVFVVLIGIHRFVVKGELVIPQSPFYSFIPRVIFAVLFIVIILLLVVKHEPSSFSSLYSLFVIVPLLFVMTEELQVGFCLALLTLAATQSITFFLHSYIASQKLPTTQVTILHTLLWLSSMHLSFFATGHHNHFGAIDLASGFVFDWHFDPINHPVITILSALTCFLNFFTHLALFVPVFIPQLRWINQHNARKAQHSSSTPTVTFAALLMSLHNVLLLIFLVTNSLHPWLWSVYAPQLCVKGVSWIVFNVLIGSFILTSG